MIRSNPVFKRRNYVDTQICAIIWLIVLILIAALLIALTTTSDPNTFVVVYTPRNIFLNRNTTDAIDSSTGQDINSIDSSTSQNINSFDSSTGQVIFDSSTGQNAQNIDNTVSLSISSSSGINTLTMSSTIDSSTSSIISAQSTAVASSFVDNNSTPTTLARKYDYSNDVNTDGSTYNFEFIQDNVTGEWTVNDNAIYSINGVFVSSIPNTISITRLRFHDIINSPGSDNQRIISYIFQDGLLIQLTLSSNPSYINVNYKPAFNEMQCNGNVNNILEISNLSCLHASDNVNASFSTIAHSSYAG